MAAGYGRRIYALRGSVTPPALAYTADRVINVGGILRYRGNPGYPLIVLGGTIKAADDSPAATLKIHVFGRELDATEIPAANDTALDIPASALGAYMGAIEPGGVLADVGGFLFRNIELATNKRLYINPREQALAHVQGSTEPLRLGFLLEADDAQTWTAAKRVDIELIAESI